MIDFEKIRSSFPILDVKVNDNKLVYFDNAATTQTPTQVTNSIRDYFNKQNSNIHRGVHHLSNISTEEFEQSRKKVKEFIGAEKEEEIVFTRGTTDSINLVATSCQKFLKNGDEILISEMEHHSNIVPWQLCAEKTGAKLKVVSVTKEGEIDMDHLEKLLNEKTKILSITHISNTLGTINPISEITKLARKFDTKVFIDGAQAIAHQKVNVTELDVDFYCFSAHKLYGPTGVGVLYGKEEILEKLPPYQGGGEMIELVTFEKTTYAKLPSKFEAGTPNISGVIALGKAIEFIEEINLDLIFEYEDMLLNHYNEKSNKIEYYEPFGTSLNKSAIASFNLKKVHHYDIGVLLDNMGIAVRTGHHCTQPLHKKFNLAGTIRASFGIYNTKSEIDYFFDCLSKAYKMLY